MTALAKEIQRMLDVERKRVEKEYPLHRLKTEQQLHGVKDRAEMIDECHAHGERMKTDAAMLALDALLAEQGGDYEQAEVMRASVFHQNWYAERWFELALWMTPNADLGRTAPREEECANAMEAVWSTAHNERCIKEMDEYLLRRAEDVVALIRLGHCATTPQGRDVDPRKVAELFPLSSEERRARIDAVDRVPSVLLLNPGEEAPTFDPITGTWTGCVLVKPAPAPEFVRLSTDVPEPCPHALPSDEWTGRKPGEPRIPGQITPPSVAQAVVDYIEESLVKGFVPFAGKRNAEEVREKMVAALKDELEVRLQYEDKPIEIRAEITGEFDPDRVARIFRESLRPKTGSR